MPTDELLAEALRLTRLDRARVAEELLSSLEESVWKSLTRKSLRGGQLERRSRLSIALVTPPSCPAWPGTQARDLLIRKATVQRFPQRHRVRRARAICARLRPASILRKLCYGQFRVHPRNNSTYDHGMGW